MGNLVREMLDMAQLSVLDAAAYSGIPKSNIYRYLNHEAEPTIEVLEELALACNISLSFSLNQLSDPHAAQAAKYMLEPTDTEPLSEVLSWIGRINRRRPANDFDIIRFAGEAASPLNRPGARFFKGDIHALTVASAGDFTSKGWALSGRPVLESLDLSVLPIPLILWAEDSDLAAQALDLSATRLPHPDGANIVVIPSQNGELEGAVDMKSVWVVSVLQGLLDVVSFGEKAAEQVRTYLER